MSNEEKADVKCPRCKCYRYPSEYLNDKGRSLKTCIKCRDRATISRNKTQICEHKKQRSTCVECDGSQICEHKRRRSRCVECGGSSICEHKKERSTCVDCGGSSICEHKKIRSYCVECGGGSICEHKRRRSTCVDCGGSSICEHKKERSYWVECGGSSICEHKRRRIYCVECDGSQICEHKKQRSYCVECDGGSICEHKKRRSRCVDCCGSEICEHKKQRSTCVECGGSSICEHKKIRSTCVDCTPKNACQNCFQIYIPNRSRFKPYCFRCYCVLNPDVEIPRKFMLKEHHFRDVLKEHFKELKMVFNKKVDNGCSSRRPDLRIECLTHTIVGENDENKHDKVSCENKRMMELFQDLGNRPLVMVRFNPDKNKTSEGCFKFTKTGALSLNKKEWNKRIKKLISRIQYHIDNVPSKEVTIEYLFY